MKILRAFPPNYAAIAARFPYIKGRAILFCYGGTIYNPKGIAVTPELHVHEAVHSVRQDERTPEEWWKLYLTSSVFRLQEEALAHKAEFKEYCAHHYKAKERDNALEGIAGRLCGPLYAGIVTLEEAKVLVS